MITMKNKIIYKVVKGNTYTLLYCRVNLPL